MQESITLIPDIDEAGVEARHEFLHFCDVDVAHREVGRAGLVLVFNQSFVLKQHTTEGVPPLKNSRLSLLALVAVLT